MILAALLSFAAGNGIAANDPPGEVSAPANSPSTSSTMSVEYHEGLYTIAATQSPLRALLSEIGLKGGVRFEVDASLRESLITVAFSGKTLEEALGAVLDQAGQKNIAVEYEALAGKDRALKARRVFLARRDVGSGAPKTVAEPTSEQSTDNVIRYEKFRLTVKVKDMDVMELLAAIERAINREIQREYRILVNDVIDARISIEMTNETAENVLDNIIYRLRPMRYVGEVHTSYLVPEGANQKTIAAYIIRRLSAKEVAELDLKIKNYLETAKRLSEEGAFLEAQNYFGGLYTTDRFNADGEFYSALNTLKQGQPSADFFKRVLELDPDYVVAFYWLGVASEKQEDYRAAAEAYKDYLARGKDENLLSEAKKKLVALEKAESSQYFQDFWRARSIREKKDLPTAERIYQDLITREPGRPEAYGYLALNYVRQRKLDEAYNMLQKAADLPNKDRLLCIVGEAYLGQQEYAKARQVFEALLRKGLGKDLRDSVERAMKDLK